MSDLQPDASGAVVQQPERIAAYHAHCYDEPAESRDPAALLRERVAALFPDARLGRWHDQPVGPHPQAMFQIAFAPDRLSAILPWLCSTAPDWPYLSILDTGNAYADHARTRSLARRNIAASARCAETFGADDLSRSGSACARCLDQSSRRLSFPGAAQRLSD